MKIDKVYSNKVTVKIAIIKFPSDKDLCTQKNFLVPSLNPMKSSWLSFSRA